MGVIGKGCYLSETWNRLDFFIVFAGYVMLVKLKQILLSHTIILIDLSFHILITPSIYFSALEYCLDVEKLNLSTIRTVRVLRPLRAINRIPSKYKFIYIIYKYCSLNK